MSKILKNVLVVFALLCIIVLIVFCVSLFSLNKGNGGGSETGPSVSGSPPVETGNSPGAKPTATGTPSPTNSGSPGDAGQSADISQTPSPSSTPAGKRYDLLMPDNMTLTLYAKEQSFKYFELQDGYIFTYTGGGTASLEVSLVYLPQGMDTLVKDFLDNYLNGQKTSVGEEGSIGNSTLSGVFVSGDSDGEIYEAWIHHFTNSDINDMGVAFILHYRDDAQKSALYSILDTLDLT